MSINAFSVLKFPILWSFVDSYWNKQLETVLYVYYNIGYKSYHRSLSLNILEALCDLFYQLGVTAGDVEETFCS